MAPPLRRSPYAANVERWRSLVERYFRPEDVDKALYIIQGESGGNPGIVNPESGATGLFQILRSHGVRGEDPETAVQWAANQVYNVRRNWGDWGEGVTYQGRPFGILGFRPYSSAMAEADTGPRPRPLPGPDFRGARATAFAGEPQLEYQFRREQDPERQRILRAYTESLAPDERRFALESYEGALDLGLAPGEAYRQFLANLKEIGGNIRPVGPLAQPLSDNPVAAFLQAASGPFEIAGEALATLAEPLTRQLPSETQSATRRFLRLLPAFLVGPGPRLFQGGLRGGAAAAGSRTGYAGVSAVGGETAEAAGAPGIVGEFAAPVAAGVGSAALRSRFRPPLARATEDLTLIAPEEPARPLPGQRGLFGEEVTAEGAVRLPPPELGTQRPEFRGEQGGIQPSILGAEEAAATGARYQPGLGEFATPAPTARERMVDALIPERPPVAPEPAGEPNIVNIPRERIVVKVDDLEYRPDLFQARDADPGQAISNQRVEQLVRGYDPGQFTPPSVVLDPERPGKYIVYRGHHRTEAYRRIYGNDADIEVQLVHADIENPAMLRTIQLEGDASNFKTALPNFRESVRAIQRAEALGLSDIEIGDRLRKGVGEVEALKDAARLGASAIDRIVVEPGLGPYATELGRGIRVYGFSEEDAAGWFNRIATASKGQRPTVSVLREMVDKFGKQIAALPQGALFETGGFEGTRGGLLAVLDENAKLRTSLQGQVAQAKRLQRQVKTLADTPSASVRDKTAAQRLANLAQREVKRLQGEIATNDRDLLAAFQASRQAMPRATVSAGESGTPLVRTSVTSTAPGAPQAPSRQISTRAAPQGISVESETMRATRPPSIIEGPSRTLSDLGVASATADPSSRPILANVQSIEEGLELARQAKPGVDEAFAAIGGEAYYGSRVKTNLGRLEQKLLDRTPAQISDYLGARFIGSQQQLSRITTALHERYGIAQFKVVEGDPLRTPMITADVNLPEGITAEVQLLTPEVASVFEQLHKEYEVFRNPAADAAMKERAIANARYIVATLAPPGTVDLPTAKGIMRAAQQGTLTPEQQRNLFAPESPPRPPAPPQRIRGVVTRPDGIEVPATPEEVRGAAQRVFSRGSRGAPGITLPGAASLQTPEQLEDALVNLIQGSRTYGGRRLLSGVSDNEVREAVRDLVPRLEIVQYATGSRGRTAVRLRAEAATQKAVEEALTEAPPAPLGTRAEPMPIRVAPNPRITFRPPAPAAATPPAGTAGGAKPAHIYQSTADFDPDYADDGLRASVPLESPGHVPRQGDFLYHFSPAEGLPTVEQTGLKPSTGGDIRGAFKERARFYRQNYGVTLPRNALYAADNARILAAVDRDSTVQNWALLRFRQGQERWLRDPEWSLSDPGAWYTRQAIAPERIEVWTGSSWEPIRGQPTSPAPGPVTPPASAAAAELATAPAGAGQPPPRGPSGPRVEFPAGEGRQPAFEGLEPRTPLPTLIARTLGDVVTLPFATLFGFDYSYPLRQGALLVRHAVRAKRDAAGNIVGVVPGPWAQSFGRGVRAIFSEQYGRQQMSRIERGTYAQFKNKLHYSPFEGGRMADREETFVSRLTNVIPLLRQTGRGVAVFINTLRSDLVDDFIRTELRHSGSMPNQRLIDAYANYVNRATGWGNLGEFEESVVLLNQVFSSARRNVAMFQVPGYLFNRNAAVRREAWLDLLSYLGLGATTLELAHLAGAEVGLDPTDADFGKIKIGNTRIDIWAGYVQTARMLYKLVDGLDETPNAQDITDALLPYLRNKLRPGTAGLVYDVAAGETPIGERVNIGSVESFGLEMLKRSAPLFGQEIYDAYVKGGPGAALLTLPSFVGVGVSTYETTTDVRDRVSKEKFGKKYEELDSPLEQKQVNDTEAVKAALARLPSEYQQAKQAAYGDIQLRQEQAESAFGRGQLTQPLPDIWHDLSRERQGARSALQAAFKKTLDKFEHDRFDKAVDGYYRLEERNADGTINWDATEAKRQTYVRKLAEKERLWVEDFLDVQTQNQTPLRQRYLRYVEEREQLGYFKPGLKTAELQALDKAHPEMDVLNWYWKGGVADKAPPTLQTAAAIETALQMGLPNRPVKLMGLARPVNQTTQTRAAWDESKGQVTAFLFQAVDRFKEQEARRLYDKPYAQLKDDQKTSVARNIRVSVRQNDPKLDAWLVWWGYSDKLQTLAAGQEFQRLLQRYGKQPPREGFKAEYVANPR